MDVDTPGSLRDFQPKVIFIKGVSVSLLRLPRPLQLWLLTTGKAQRGKAVRSRCCLYYRLDIATMRCSCKGVMV